MDGATNTPARPLPTTRPRRLVNAAVLGVCFLVGFRVLGVEPYEVPTGSMAPAITGHHRAVDCPDCGAHILVGRHPSDPGGSKERPHCYDKVRCGNCGCGNLGLGDAPEAAGDRLLVNKNVFLWRRPRRWEIVVFRLFGKAFVKRLIGLPGEVLEILYGDVYINGELVRKSLAELKTMRILVFDNNCQPQPDGWRERWEVPPSQSGPHPLVGTELHLDGSQSVSYRHYLLDEQKYQPICDEYTYNGGECVQPTPVHDFMVECDVEVAAGQGDVYLSLTDGLDTLTVELPVGSNKPVAIRSEPSNTESVEKRYRSSRGLTLQPGRRYHVEVAFVDRRLSLAVDGCYPLEPLDLPAAPNRNRIIRPVTLGSHGVRVVVRNVRLFRDIHYTQAGRNGVRGKVVRLGSEQYFVLGDNSPNSDDSRFWPDHGAVPAHSLIGKPFLVHLPSRAVTWEGLGGRWQMRIPDLGRVRWLR